MIESLSAKIQNEEKVLIHCRGGIGRAGLISAGLLIIQGFKAEDAIELVSESRHLQSPETIEQVDWLKEFELKLK